MSKLPTHDQLHALRDEALAAGDYAQSALCAAAMRAVDAAAQACAAAIAPRGHLGLDARPADQLQAQPAASASAWREGEIMTDADAIIVATHILGCWGLHGRAVPDSNIVRAVRAELAPEYPTDAEVEAVAAAVRRLREQA